MADLGALNRGSQSGRQFALSFMHGRALAQQQIRARAQAPVQPGPHPSSDQVPPAGGGADSSPYPTPAKGWPDGQVPWNERLPVRGGRPVPHMVQPGGQTGPRQQALDAMRADATGTPANAWGGPTQNHPFDAGQVQALQALQQRLAKRGVKGDVTLEQRRAPTDRHWTAIGPKGKRYKLPLTSQAA